MSSVLTLSGWAQPAEALLPLFPHATAFDYSAFADFDAAQEALKRLAPTQVIGWSMGGQVALRAIAAGVLKPQHLTLIAAPYKFTCTDGMDKQTFSQFRDNYNDDPARTKQRFHALVAKGEQQPREVIEKLTHHTEVENTQRFLPWLEELGRFDSASLNLANIPPTLIIHGMNDHIVPIAQGEKLQRALPKARLNRWEGTGHAPHLADPARLLHEITEHRHAHV